MSAPRIEAAQPSLTAAPDRPGRCVACHGELAPWISVRSAEPTLEEPFRLWRCERCGSAVTDGATADGWHETGLYRSVAPRFGPVVTPLRRSFAREKVRILESVASPPAAVLDIGAGRGTFVAEARAAGYGASGIEPASQRATTSANSLAAVQSVSIEDAEIADGSLDVVTLWHALEHLEAPDDALRRVSGWLRADGLIIVAVPNIASLQAKIGRSRWFHLDVPRHRTHFTPKGLVSLLRLVGFEPVLDKRLLLEHNFLGMWQTLVNRATKHPSYLYGALKRNISLRSTDLPISLACIPLLPIAVGLELLADLLGQAGTMVMVARRLPSDRVSD